jgi:hypothetical protein
VSYYISALSPLGAEVKRIEMAFTFTEGDGGVDDSEVFIWLLNGLAEMKGGNEFTKITSVKQLRIHVLSKGYR